MKTGGAVDFTAIFCSNIFKLRCRQGGTMRLSPLTQSTHRPLTIALVSFVNVRVNV